MITNDIILAAGAILDAKATDFQKIRLALEAALEKANAHPVYRARRGDTVSDMFGAPDLALADLTSLDSSKNNLTVVEFTIEGSWQVWKRLL